MWNQPWKYREGIAISLGLLITGSLLQAAVGPVDWSLLMWPVNIIVLCVLIVLLAVFYFLRSNATLFQFMTQVEAAVPALATASVLTVIMGLTRQVPEGHVPVDPLGLTRMLSFWPFVLIYLWNMIIVAEVSIRQMVHFKTRYIPSLISHLGLFIFVVCGTLGSADMQRLKMYCEENKTEWRALDNEQRVVELPFAIELKKFSVEENPVKFISDANIYTKAGETMQARIEVNKPFSVDGWKVYQYDYGQMEGGTFSVFELVYDPWLPITYGGIFLLMAGAILMFITAGRARKKVQS